MIKLRILFKNNIGNGVHEYRRGVGNVYNRFYQLKSRIFTGNKKMPRLDKNIFIGSVKMNYMHRLLNKFSALNLNEQTICEHGCVQSGKSIFLNINIFCEVMMQTRIVFCRA